MKHKPTPWTCWRSNKSRTYRWLLSPLSCLHGLIVFVAAVGIKLDLKPAVYLQKRTTSDWLILGQLTQAVPGSGGDMKMFFSSTLSMHPGEGWNSAWRLFTVLLLHNTMRGKVHLIDTWDFLCINNNMTSGRLFVLRKETQIKHVVTVTTQWWNVGLSTTTVLQR